MAPNNAYAQYRENSVYTAAPEDLMLMLYNGLVKFLMQAQMSICDKRIEKAGECIIKAQDIISEFRYTLDRKYEISCQLDLLYDYMHRRLVEANIKKDEEIVKEILGHAKELRDTWENASKLAKQQQKKSADTQMAK
ncbi:MAG: flagellar export chaperone FliS [Clostridium sp.]|nr:flagellar export chaperone FliS [Clostridium sp.]